MRGAVSQTNGELTSFLEEHFEKLSSKSPGNQQFLWNDMGKESIDVRNHLFCI